MNQNYYVSKHAKDSTMPVKFLKLSLDPIFQQNMLAFYFFVKIVGGTGMLSIYSQRNRNPIENIWANLRPLLKKKQSFGRTWRIWECQKITEILIEI